MMHDSVRAWVAGHADALLAPVLEVGSLYVNGTVRDLCPTPYVGVDIVGGPGVDRIYDGITLPFEPQSFATVICTEVFEHCADPVGLAVEIVSVLQEGGIALVTARGVGFPLHHEPDRWRFMPGCLAELFTRHGCVATEEADPECSGWFVRAERLT